MTLNQFNAWCALMPATHHVVQWGESHVWKVGGEKGKVFAIAGLGAKGAEGLAITFKVSEVAWEVLRGVEGCRPAPYLASRGMKWIQSYRRGLTVRELKGYLEVSHMLVASGLTKKLRREVGLLPP